MNWDAIGTIAEVVSATGVIVSLLYVAVQIRQSNNLSKANTIHLTSSEYGSIIGEIATDESLATIYAAATKGEDLGDIELIRYTAFLTRYFAYMENVYFQEKATLFDVDLESDNVMAFMANQSSDLLVSGQARIWWLDEAPKFLSPEFHDVAGRAMQIEGGIQ